GARHGDRRRLRVHEQHAVLPRPAAARARGRRDRARRGHQVRSEDRRGVQEGAAGDEEGARDLRRPARRPHQPRFRAEGSAKSRADGGRRQAGAAPAAAPGRAEAPAERGRARPRGGEEEQVSKIVDKLQGAERERYEREKSAEEVASARAGEERRGLDLARERQAAEVELRRLAHARAEAEAKAARLVAERERAEAAAAAESRQREE